MTPIDLMNALLRKSGRLSGVSFAADIGVPRPWMPPWRVLALEMIKGYSDQSLSPLRSR